MAIENPVEQLYEACANAVRTRYGLSADSKVDWKLMYAAIIGEDPVDDDKLADETAKASLRETIDTTYGPANHLDSTRDANYHYSSPTYTSSIRNRADNENEAAYMKYALKHTLGELAYALRWRETVQTNYKVNELEDAIKASVEGRQYFTLNVRDSSNAAAFTSSNIRHNATWNDLYNSRFPFRFNFTRMSDNTYRYNSGDSSRTLVIGVPGGETVKSTDNIDKDTTYILVDVTDVQSMTFYVVDKYGEKSKYTAPAGSRWNYMIDNTNFTSVTASDGTTYVQYKYSSAFIYNNAGTYVSPNDKIVENTTYYSYEGSTTFTVRIATSKSNTDTVSATFSEAEIANGITWTKLADKTSKISISGTSVKYNSNTIYKPSTTQDTAVSSSDTINTNSTYRTYKVNESTGIVFYFDNLEYTCAKGTKWSTINSQDVLPHTLYEITNEYSAYKGCVSPLNSTGQNESYQHVIVLDVDNDASVLWTAEIRNEGKYKVETLNY